MTLPFAAGLSYVEQLMKPEFRRKQQLFFANHAPYVLPAGSRGVNTEISPGGYIDQQGDSTFPNVGARTAWSNTPNATLQFATYVYEDFHHARGDEKISVRFFRLYFHLEDDTIKISEQILNTSNIYDGKFLHRQRVPRYDNPDKHITLYDLIVGKPVIIYGRQHMIYKCDSFTRTTMAHMGFEVPEDLTPPVSQLGAIASVNKGMMETLHRHINPDLQFAKFLKEDGKVLRFYAIYDDRQSMYGDRHSLMLQYYLADDTLEIFRKTPQLHGRDKWEIYLRRIKVPKETKNLNAVTPGSPWPVLKTMPNSKQPVKGYHLFDQAQFPDTVETFSDKDLDCGKMICVFGRTLFLHDCDDYTRWYYKHQYGKEMQKVSVDEDPEPVPERVIPPHNGLGMEEDSIQNVYRLVPKAMTNDARKYLRLDLHPDDPTHLSFSIKLLNPDREEANRPFVMRYSLRDDSITVSSPQEGWHGVVIGKRHVEKGHNQQSTLPDYLQPEDLYIGAAIQLRMQTFVIADADEATLKFMEKYPKRFPFANIDYVFGNFRDLIRCQPDICERICKAFAASGGNVDSDHFTSVLMSVTGNALTPHEYLTIVRAYRNFPYVSLEKRKILLRAYMQHKLRQDLWEPATKILRAFKRIDLVNTGFVPLEDASRAARATKIPVTSPVLLAYLQLINEDNGINYYQFVHDLDWVRAPVDMGRPLPSIIDDDFDFGTYFGEERATVRVCDFLKDLGCEPALTETDHKLIRNLGL